MDLQKLCFAKTVVQFSQNPSTHEKRKIVKTMSENGPKSGEIDLVSHFVKDFPVGERPRAQMCDPMEQKTISSGCQNIQKTQK